VFARAALRGLLGRYLNRAPHSIQFLYGAHGKPSVVSETPIHFNLSHSGDLAAFAVSNCPVGIDLELIRPFPNIQHVARRILCPEELAELMLVAECDRERAFFSCWTRKEAYSKALGNGLLSGFNSFRVSVRPDQPPRFLPLDSALAATWTLQDLSLSSGCAAALAHPGPERPVWIFQMSDQDLSK
jgi:4'-phosphopantetheinyl transferase